MSVEKTDLTSNTVDKSTVLGVDEKGCDIKEQLNDAVKMTKGHENSTNNAIDSNSLNTINDSEKLHNDSNVNGESDSTAVNLNDAVNENGQSIDTTDDKTEEYVDILGNGLLRKKVLVPGVGREACPDRGDIVTLDIEGHLNDGTSVDKYTAFTFSLGEGDVIQGWDLGISLMNDGETCELITSSKYAYGDKGREPDIPPNSEITYRLELLKHEHRPDLETLSTQDRLNMGEKKRERGNFLFTRQDYTGAINSYTQAIKILDYFSDNSNSKPSLLQEVLESKLKCCNNLAACQLKVDAYDAVIRSCQMVLTSQPTNVKALFRLGKAHAAKNNTNEAISYFKQALKLEPESKIVHQELSRLTKKLKTETESEKEMYRRMLGGKDWKNNNNKKKPPSWIKWTLLASGLAVAGVSIIIAAYRYH